MADDPTQTDNPPAKPALTEEQIAKIVERNAAPMFEHLTHYEKSVEDSSQADNMSPTPTATPKEDDSDPNKKKALTTTEQDKGQTALQEFNRKYQENTRGNAQTATAQHEPSTVTGAQQQHQHHQDNGPDRQGIPQQPGEKTPGREGTGQDAQTKDNPQGKEGPQATDSLEKRYSLPAKDPNTPDRGRDGRGGYGGKGGRGRGR